MTGWVDQQALKKKIIIIIVLQAKTLKRTNLTFIQINILTVQGNKRPKL